MPRRHGFFRPAPIPRPIGRSGVGAFSLSGIDFRCMMHLILAAHHAIHLRLCAFRRRPFPQMADRLSRDHRRRPGVEQKPAGPAPDGRLACTRLVRVLNRSLALANRECQWSGRWGHGCRPTETGAARGRSSRAIRPGRRTSLSPGSGVRRCVEQAVIRDRTTVAAAVSVQEDNAVWPRSLRSTRRRAAVSSGA